MLSPSDFNNAVPQFTNGSYASNPINPQYIAEPDAESYNRGTEPLQTLPAQWWNWFINKFTARFNKVNIYVKNIFNELAQVLSIFNITPDGTEQTPTTSQLKTVFETCYPQYVKNDLYGNTVGTALGTAAVGTCTTFARSDHVHPVTGLATIDNSESGFSVFGNAGDYVNFIRVPQNGILPYCEDATNGVGYIGSSTWPFFEINAKTFCGNLVGNAASSSSIYVNPYSASYNFNIVLTNSNEGGNQPLFASTGSSLIFNPSTGVLTAASFTGTVTGKIWANLISCSKDSEAEAELLDVVTDIYGYITRLRIGLSTWNAGFRDGVIKVGCDDAGTAWNNFYFKQGQGGDVITSATIGCCNAGSANRAFGLVMERNLWTAYTGVWYCGEKVAYTNFCNPTDDYILAFYTPYKYPDKFYYCGTGVLLIPPHGLIEPSDGLSVTQTGDGIRLF